MRLAMRTVPVMYLHGSPYNWTRASRGAQSTWLMHEQYGYA